MILSILIPTLPERSTLLANMVSYIGQHEGVEIITDDRGRHITTGHKRNDLIQRAQGDYTVFVDDDDYVTPDYTASILEALNSRPDVVTFEGWYTENGRNRVDWVIKLGERYEARTENGKYMFFRFPNHLCPVKRSITAQVKFPPITQGEDYQWAVKLQPYLKTSVHIPKLIYHYAFRTNK